MLDEFTIKRLVANKKELEGYFIEVKAICLNDSCDAIDWLETKPERLNQ
jgi:hypothetical protein